MLSSFRDKYMSSVFRAPDDEGGADVETNVSDIADTGDSSASTDDQGGAVDGGEETGEAPQKLSVRDEIKKAMADSSQEAQAKVKPPQRQKKASAPVDPANKAAAAALDPTKQAPAASQTTVPAPARLSPEAKAEWDKAPEAVKQAFVKAEQDMQRGVDELKSRYSLIDQAIAPHADALRQMNATPGEAVNRMFLWFKALAGDPAQAFPLLAKSMGFDWTKVAQATMQAAAQQQPGTAPEIPEPVRNYVSGLEQQIQRLGQQLNNVQSGFGSMQQDVQAQNEAKARDNLAIWSKDKEFFEEVRQDMGQLLQTGMVPLKNGQVDLDSAYEHAIYFNPDVRAKVLAKQQQANQQVQQAATAAATTAKQAQVEKARKAAVSLPSGNAPGAEPGKAPQKPGKKMSVRESLKAAMAELRDQ
jgi:hypothetical protein